MHKKFGNFNYLIVIVIIVSILINSLFSGVGFVNPNAKFPSNSVNQRSARSSHYIIDLNLTTSYAHHNCTIYGAKAGYSGDLSTASGDVNGDGLEDIIIGFPWACKVYVVLGGSSLNGYIDLGLQPDMIINGTYPIDTTGYSVAAGDVNGDTIDDIIIGDWSADGPSDSRTNCGEIYVVFGSTSLPEIKNLSSSPPDLTIYGAESFDSLGSNVDCCDINGDNIEDIIACAIQACGPGNARTFCGEVYVIYGNTILTSEIDLASQADVTIYGIDMSDKIGKSTAAGDVNNDGFNDIIISSEEARGPGNTRQYAGEVYLIYGNNSLNPVIDLKSDANVTIFGNENSWLGSSLASGDLNGDNIDDVVMGAPFNDTVHIIFGSASLPSIHDIQNKPTDITIYGASESNGVGNAVETGDFNNDGKDDIIIGSPYANIPNMGRNNSGEVYVINGSSSMPSEIYLELLQEDILIYGAESGDYAGMILATGKIDSDNKYDIIIGAPGASGPDNKRQYCGEIHLILTAGNVFPNLKPEFIGLINGDGVDNRICYAKLKPYNFRVKATDSKGFSDLNNVILGLDYNNQNLQFSWSESTNEFTEIWDPLDYITLNATSSAHNDGKNSWIIDFNLTFNWSYPDNNFHNIQIYSISDGGLYAWLNITNEIYRVENQLNFYGDLVVTGNYHGVLDEMDWVRGGEQLTWGGLKVVYQNTSSYFPTKDSGFEVTVWDALGNYWLEIPNPGENISILANATMISNSNEIFTINITGVPPYCDQSNISFSLKIDADNVTFSNPFPNEEEWQTVLNPQCGITISDPTTKVNASSIQYQISRDNGTSWENDWIDVDVQQQDSKSIDCFVKPRFKDGRDNLVKYRAKDILGNGFTESEAYKILIDVSNVSFTDFSPSSEVWQTSLTVYCNITITDNLSGVNASSIEFRFSTAGIFNYGQWQSARQTGDANIIYGSVNPTFEEGEDNYIQWRATDMEGNGPFISEDYQIKIKLNYPPVTSLISPGNGNIIKTLSPELLWSASDPDGDSLIQFDIYLSTDQSEVTNLESQARLISNYVETKYKVGFPLNDSQIYYWIVVPNDGFVEGSCKSGIWQFKIDTAIEIPKVTLISPFNNSNISTQTPTLSWNINYSDVNIVTYRVFLDTIPIPQNLTENYQLTSYSPSTPLIRGTTYYWTIIPIANTAEGKIQGTCRSGIWSFTVGLSIIHVYGLELELESEYLKVKQGDFISTNITITNTGNTFDIINLNLEKGIIDANVALEHLGTPLWLNSSESIKLKLEIKTFENIEVKNYTIKIIAISNGALSENQDVTVSKILRLQVIEKEIKNGQDEDHEKGSDLGLWIAILIIIIIIALSLFLYNKKKVEKKSTVEAEIEYKPPELAGLPGITLASPEAQPELPPPTVVDAQAQITASKAPMPTLPPTTEQPQYQLPQATLTKAQKFALLDERLLRGEISEETYKELKARIETPEDEEANEEDLEEE